MRRLLLVFAVLLAPSLAHAWNAAGHRLIAVIAWQQLSPDSRSFLSDILLRHADYPRWVERAKSPEGEAILAEASTWADEIRNDPRFYDEAHESPTPPLPGLPDTARHKRWHYVDLDRHGKHREGELDQQIERLSTVLRSSRQETQLGYALPWLLHLVGDIHQPLHVGLHEDEGGNAVAIENPFNKRLPFSSLHTYWDDLPGPPWLRGKRLTTNAARLIADFAAPEQATVAHWRDESRRLHGQVYPLEKGSLLPIIDQDFHQQAKTIANRRIVDAGYRLGRLLDAIVKSRVSRGTP